MLEYEPVSIRGPALLFGLGNLIDGKVPTPCIAPGVVINGCSGHFHLVLFKHLNNFTRQDINRWLTHALDWSRVKYADQAWHLRGDIACSDATIVCLKRTILSWRRRKEVI